LAEVAQVKRTVRQYLTELEEENGDGEPPPVQEQDKVSTTDPDATYASKGKGLATLGYYDNYLIDNPSCVMVGVQATAARFSQESVAAREMITRFHQRQRRYPQSLAADTSYGNGELLHWLQQREITPYMRVKQNAQRKNDRYGIEKFTYDEEANRHLCPAGKTLTYVGVNALNRTHVYAATLKRCRDCPPKTQCTKGRCRFLGVHIHEAARQRAQELARTPVAVEKVGFAEIRLKMGDQKCIRSRRESFIGLPRATVFQRNFRERLFQQLHRPSSRRNGLVEKWRRCLPNSRTRSDCVVCACVE
jgi:hypothetical protein